MAVRPPVHRLLLADDHPWLGAILAPRLRFCGPASPWRSLAPWLLDLLLDLTVVRAQVHFVSWSLLVN